MALTYRSTKGSALTILELDNNFRYFTGSHAVTGSFVAQYQRPITSSNIDLTASIGIAGYFVQVSSSLTCSLQPNASVPLSIGTEIQFFNSASSGEFCLHTGSGVTTQPPYTTNKWALQRGFDCTIKKVDTDIWVIYGNNGQ